MASRRVGSRRAGGRWRSCSRGRRRAGGERRRGGGRGGGGAFWELGDWMVVERVMERVERNWKAVCVVGGGLSQESRVLL